MSLLAGFFDFDARPLTGDSTVATLLASCHTGSCEGSAVSPLPHLVLFANVEPFDSLSKVERQPHLFSEGRVLVWDGRLDNRDDLLVTLHRDLRGDRTDAALVAAAYTRWRQNCLPRLIGDWTLAIWDAPCRTLLIARDYAGNRPLYYRELPGKALAFATRIDALAAAFKLYSEPDENYIAAHLVSTAPPHLTPFKFIRPLLAGHVLEAHAERGVTVRRYWTFSPTVLTYSKRETYSEHLRALLIEAVKVRLRSNRTVWSDLSGGWDSSSIVCLSHNLIAEGTVSAPAIQPVSMVISNSPESDETEYIEAVERWCDLKTVRHDYEGVPTYSELVGFRHPSTRPRRFILESHVDTAGDRVSLSGELGDVIMYAAGSVRFGIMEPLLQGRFREWSRLVVGRARDRRQPLWTLLTRMLWDTYRARKPLTFAQATRYGRWARRFDSRFRNADTVGAVTAAAKALTPEYPSLPAVLLQDFSVLKRPLVESLYVACERGALQSNDWSSANVSRTFPYSHRPLVEFVLGIPFLALWEPEVRRAGMRRALADVLPPEILDRNTKGEPKAALSRAHRKRREQLAQPDSGLLKTESWLLVRRGYLDPVILRRAIHTLHDESLAKTPLKGRWIRFEAWLQTLHALTPQPTPWLPIAPSERSGEPTTYVDSTRGFASETT